MKKHLLITFISVFSIASAYAQFTSYSLNVDATITSPSQITNDTNYCLLQFDGPLVNVTSVRFYNTLGEYWLSDTELAGWGISYDYVSMQSACSGVLVTRIPHPTFGFANSNLTVTVTGTEVAVGGEFSAIDTATAWQNGVASVNCPDSTAGYNLGFSNGVASVVCPDSAAGYDLGFTEGIASVSCPDSIAGYNLGYTEGANSVDTIAPYNNGYQTGLDACESVATSQLNATTNLQVYPNPVSIGNNVQVNCTNYLQTEVYNASGVLLLKSTEREIQTHAFNKGMHILRVLDQNGNYYSKSIMIQ